MMVGALLAAGGLVDSAPNPIWTATPKSRDEANTARANRTGDLDNLLVNAIHGSKNQVGLQKSISSPLDISTLLSNDIVRSTMRCFRV